MLILVLFTLFADWCVGKTEEVQYARFTRNRMFISCILFSTDHIGGGQNASDGVGILHFMI